MDTLQPQNPLGYEKLPKLLKTYAIPSIIALLVSSLYNIVDQIFIGQGIGYLGNAATNVAFPLTTICLSLALLIGVGGAARFSLALGAKNQEQAELTVGCALSMMTILGLAYFVIIQIFLTPLLQLFGATPDVMPYAVSYTHITSFGLPLVIATNSLCSLARADGSPKFSMSCMLTGAIINTLLDPLFIFVFDMGIEGAAYATVIGQVISFLMALNYIRHFKHVHIKKHHLVPNLHEYMQIASLGMSNSLNQLAITLVQIVMNNSLIYYGAQSIYGSDIPLACSGIVMKTNAILIAVLVGISQGAQPIISFNYGAKNYDRVRGIYKLAVLCSVIVTSIGFIAFQFFPKQLISLFGTGDELYFSFAVKFMRIFLFMVIVTGMQIISSNFFAAIGKAIKGVVLTLSRQVLFLIPLIVVFPLFLGIDGILFAAPVADTLAFCVTTTLILKELAHMKHLSSSSNISL